MSGFKSFVDRTEINISDQRTGVIGPNGCGKSNIIDAVKWVLGDTSKQIRGNSMEDVIFNGTDTRKPNDFAFVELLFSNTENKLGGEYAKYDEISVKREVSRDGSSKYFLNNTSCRRRDVVDIFLGTGLGPKSYAIINQGTASKIIESKPEEFRVYVEEVAGISKYRERRRETEIKIEHTKDNLDRLNDLVKEVNKQLSELKKQAEQADKYKKLSSEKDKIKSEILAISVRDLNNKISKNDEKISKKNISLEKTNAKISKIQSEIEKLKDKYNEKNNSLDKVQQKYYEAMGEAGKIEKAIEYESAGAEKNKREYDEQISKIEEIKSEIIKIGQEISSCEEEIRKEEDNKKEGIEKENIISREIASDKQLTNERRKELDEINNNRLNINRKHEIITSKISTLENEIKRTHDTINNYKKNIKNIEEQLTNSEILTLDQKINLFIEESDKFLKDNNSDDIQLNKIKDILLNIQDLSKSIQEAEFENAKRNEELKNEISNKIIDEENNIASYSSELKGKESELLSITKELEDIENDISERKDNILELEGLISKKEKDLEECKESVFKIDLNVETLKVRISVQNTNKNNLEKDLTVSEESSKSLLSQDTDPEMVLSNLKNELDIHLKNTNESENEMKDLREEISLITNDIQSNEDNKEILNNEANSYKDEINEFDKFSQEMIGQIKTLNEQSNELNIDNENVLDSNTDYNLEEWKKREVNIARQLDRMGPINMAAIDQFKDYEERSSYLNLQKEDLMSALDTLSEAIKKIDKDTKERFKETFDMINEKLSEIFPRLFNGGKAYLKLTDKDLLKTGIEVFACPPGKKLTSINLLSGGEKALTAISLLFSLFSLNPAPFCMLDEIDAPLDDINLDRFCRLLTDMSTKTQFIVITHKKPTMEYVEQLIGVTMGEQGVSKIVNVNLNE